MTDTQKIEKELVLKMEHKREEEIQKIVKSLEDNINNHNAENPHIKIGFNDVITDLIYKGKY